MPSAAATLYLKLLKQNLMRIGFEDRYHLLSGQEVAERCPADITGWLAKSGFSLVEERAFNPEARNAGRDWPSEGETMIGTYRLDNIEAALRDIIENEIPGDLIETGVWRGGACIFMRGVLGAYGDTKRSVWVADSFRGLPRPDPAAYPADGPETAWGQLWMAPQLAVSLETVKDNFARYGLLDGQVRFLPGWFRETLPSAPIDRLALMRLDGDMYESTIIALRSLYPKLSPGGYVLVDDYNDIAACKQAVDDFRQEYGIREPIQPVDWTGVYWKSAR